MAFGNKGTGHGGYSLPGQSGRGRSKRGNGGAGKGRSLFTNQRSSGGKGGAYRRTTDTRAARLANKGNRYGGKPGVPRKTIAIIAAVVAAALVVSVLVGVVVYNQTVKNALKADLDIDALARVLTEPEEDATARWVVGVRTDSSSAEEGRGNVEGVMLGYLDYDNKTISLIQIPNDTRVYIDGYGYRPVSDAFALGRETGVVTAVQRLFGIQANHYMELNELGLSRLEESLVVGEADRDPADAYSVVKALCAKVFGSSSEQISARVTAVSGAVASDMSDEELSAMCTALQGIDVEAAVYTADAPCTVNEDDGGVYEELIETEWDRMLTRITGGLPPQATEKELSKYESMRSSYEVTIWNGVGVTGIAADCAEELKRLGWSIESTGNAANFVYNETLVVYKDTDDEPVAELLVSDLAQGRAVRSAARYSFEGDILVVVGQDYQPY